MQIITISRDRLNEVQEKMCDDFCVWPGICATEERLYKHCEECPLNNLSKEEVEQNEI